jgi:hypothetical protein
MAFHIVVEYSNSAESAQVICGICGKCIKAPTLLDATVPISDWDKAHNSARDHSYNCCGHSWLINRETGKSIDCGPALISSKTA